MKSATAPKSLTRYMIVVSALTALSGMLFGYDTAIIGSAILFIKKDFGLTTWMEEAVVSSVLLSAIAGALISGDIADRFGRKKAIIGTSVVCIVGALWCSFAESGASLVLGRLILGLSLGFASYAAPLYISETAPEDRRGLLVTFNQICLTGSQTVAYLVAYLFTPTANWRWMLGLGGAPALVLLIGISFAPESPRWLVLKGYTSKARSALTSFRGRAFRESELDEIRESVREESQHWRNVLEPWMRMPLMIGVGLAVFQQATGINTIVYYAPTIFSETGFASDAAAILASLGISLTNVGVTVCAMLLMDWIGRRKLLMISLSGMVLSLVTMGFAYRVASGDAIGETYKVGSLFLYMASFAIGLGPVFWLLIGEIYPKSIRARAMSLATVANWAFNFLVGATFLSMINAIGIAFSFWFYAAVSMASWLFAYFLVPETKGLTLEQIEKRWRQETTR